MKPEVKITDVEIWPASGYFGRAYEGQEVATGVLAEKDHRGWPEGYPIRTSIIVNYNEEDGIIETLNTIYIIV